MASTENGQSQVITSINVTPLVDVVLVLLIIFMATAPLLHRRAVNVSVPSASHNERATESLLVLFTADKQVIIEDKTMTLEGLGLDLRARLQVDPGLRVSVAADKTVPYGDVVDLLDVVRGAGVKKAALEVKGKPK